MIVTQDNIEAINESISFQEKSDYNKIICGKTLKGGPQKKIIDQSINNLELVGITDSEKEFYYGIKTSPVCCLPKNHQGKCVKSYEDFFSTIFKLKIRDCSMGPGDDDIIYKNRISRIFPIQISNSKEFELKNTFHLKSRGVKLKSAIAIKNSSTPFLVATAEIDFASFILQIDSENRIPTEIKTFLNEHYKNLVEHYKNQDIFITNRENNLCCPVYGHTILPDHFDKNSGGYQVQFGHVEPVSNNRYMTRGKNIVLISRNGNLMQTDDSLRDIRHKSKTVYEHTNNIQ